MHFPIIQICKTREDAKENRITESDLYEDRTVAYFTDYVGDTYTEEQRKEYLRKDHLKNLFAGIADVDETGKISFYSEEEIRATLRKEYEKVLESLEEQSEEGHIRGYDLRAAGEYFRGSEEMFYFESCTQCSGGFMEDTPYFAGKTFYVGAIIDAHV